MNNGIPSAPPSRTITEQNLITKTDEVKSLKIELDNKDKIINELKKEFELMKKQLNDLKLDFEILKFKLKIERRFHHLFNFKYIYIYLCIF
jgi:nitrogen fixation/metabolism regulation signal transduction histidine kinase